MQQCQWCLSTVVVSSVSRLCRHERHKIKQQYSKLIGRFDSHRRIGKMPGSYSSIHCLSRLIYLYHVSAHSPTCLRRCSQQTRAALVVLGCAVVNHAREHVNILEYTEYFRAYTDLGNQGTTNAGQMIDSIIIIPRRGAVVCGARSGLPQ